MDVIQVGCNDGNDHVFEKCKENKHILNKVILIDADEISLRVAEKRYKDEGINVEVYHFAVVPVEGCDQLRMFTTVDPKYAVFTSVDNKYITTYLPKEKYKECVVPARSLTKVLEDAGAFNLDWLFIDCEGMDAINLLSVDFDKFKIKNIVFEHLHTDGFSKTGKRCEALDFYLEKFGYKVLEDQNNKSIGEYNTLAYL